MTLSDKIERVKIILGMQETVEERVQVKDVKEAIALLNATIRHHQNECDCNKEECFEALAEELKNIFGEALTK